MSTPRRSGVARAAGGGRWWPLTAASPAPPFPQTTTGLARATTVSHNASHSAWTGPGWLDSWYLTCPVPRRSDSIPRIQWKQEPCPPQSTMGAPTMDVLRLAGDLRDWWPQEGQGCDKENEIVCMGLRTVPVGFSSHSTLRVKSLYIPHTSGN